MRTSLGNILYFLWIHECKYIIGKEVLCVCAYMCQIWVHCKLLTFLYYREFENICIFSCADFKIFIVLTSLGTKKKENGLCSVHFFSNPQKKYKMWPYTSLAKTIYKICHPEMSSPYANSWKGMACFLSIPSGSVYSAEINGFV